MALSRQEMIDKLMWNTDQLGPDGFDLKSVVTVDGSPDLYTDEELTKIVEFSERRTERYDKMFRYRRGVNLIIIGKAEQADGRWLRKRLTWDRGPMYSDTLEDAIAVFEKNRTT